MNIFTTAIGSMSSEAVIDSLRDTDFVNQVIGCDIYPKEWLPVSSKLDVFHQVPKPQYAAYVPIIIDICKKHSINLLLPLTDPEIDIISENRLPFREMNITLGIPGKKAVNICRDKWTLFKYLKKSTLFNVIPGFDSVDSKSANLNFPIIGKPRKGRSSEGVIVFQDKKALMDNLDALKNYIFQPIITGDIYTVDLVRDKHNNCVSVPRKELLRTSNGAGVTVQVENNRTLIDMTNRIGELLKIIGCINVEYIHNDGQFFVMDINPRFSAGVAFTKMAGYDMIKNHLLALMGKEIDKNIHIEEKILGKKYVDLVLKETQK